MYSIEQVGQDCDGIKTVQKGICHGLLILDDTVYDIFIRHLCNAAIICTIAVN